MENSSQQSLIDSYASDLHIEAIALQLQPFEFRTRKMAELVGAQSSMLLSMSLGKVDAREKLDEIMTEACLECGMQFDENQKDFDFSKAKSATGKVAIKYIPKALATLDIEADFNQVLDQVDIIDVTRQLAKEFNIEIRKDLKAEDLIPVLREVVSENDYFRDEIENLRGHGNQFDNEEEQVLVVAETITASEYVNNQMHVSKHNGNNEKLERLQFNPYPKVKELKLKEITNKGFSKLEALYGLAFEIWKDVKMLKDANGVKMAP